MTNVIAGSPQVDALRSAGDAGPMVSLRGITRSFSNDSAAVAGLDLDIARGEIVALLGPSGCGKTTTLRCLAGLERIDSGEIWIEGQRVAGPGFSLPPSKRGIGFVFQSYALWPHMSVLRNVMYGLRLLRVAREEARTRALKMLDVVGLDGYGERLPSELSGGQQQRVALARSLVVRPRVLLLDEPLSNLDADLRARMRREIRNILTDVGITSVFVTHDRREAFGVCDRVVLMSRGRVVQVGSPETLYGRPDTVESARLLGDVNTINVADVVPDGQGMAVAQAATGEEVRGALPSGRTSKDITAAVFRPEHALICSAAAAANQPNCWPGTVTHRIYEGANVEVMVELAGWQARVVTVPSDLTHEGVSAHLHVPPDKVLFVS